MSIFKHPKLWDVETALRTLYKDNLNIYKMIIDRISRNLKESVDTKGVWTLELSSRDLFWLSKLPRDVSIMGTCPPPRSNVRDVVRFVHEVPIVRIGIVTGISIFITIPQFNAPTYMYVYSIQINDSGDTIVCTLPDTVMTCTEPCYALIKVNRDDYLNWFTVPVNRYSCSSLKHCSMNVIVDEEDEQLQDDDVDKFVILYACGEREQLLTYFDIV